MTQANELATFPRLARLRRAVASLDEAGSEAVEMAIVLPVFLLFLIGTMDVGRMAWTQGTLDYATSTAARCAAVDQTHCSTVAQIQTYAAAHAYGMTVASSAFTVASEACGQRVSVSLPFALVTPYILSQNFTLTANSCFPSEI